MISSKGDSPIMALSLLLLTFFCFVCCGDLAVASTTAFTSSTSNSLDDLAMLGVFCAFLGLLTGPLAKIFIAGALGLAALGALLGKISPSTLLLLIGSGACLLGAEELSSLIGKSSGQGASTFTCATIGQ